MLTVPGTLAQLAVLLGRDTGGLERTAAVTVGPADGPSEQVLVNPEAFTQLSTGAGPNQYSFDQRFRHGSVLRLSAAEEQRLLAAYGDVPEEPEEVSGLALSGVGSAPLLEEPLSVPQANRTPAAITNVPPTNSANSPIG